MLLTKTYPFVKCVKTKHPSFLSFLTLESATLSILILAAKQTQTLMFPQLVTHSLLYSWKTNINSLMEPLSNLACGKQRSSVKRFEKNCKFPIPFMI